MNSNSKIGVVTLHGYWNYGNRLQNYALKFIVEKLGYNVDTLVVNPESNESIHKNIKLSDLTFQQIITGISNRLVISKRKKRAQNRKIHENRTSKFKKFSKEYLSERKINLSEESSKVVINEYSYFITGSDQVWNPIEYAELPIYFLTFADKSKRLSYAPSISRDTLPKELEQEYINWLEGMSVISIREEAGAKIIKDLTGLDVPVLVDPTLLLTKEEWLSISKRAKNRPNKPYLLTYFLGGPTDKTRIKLEEIAKEKNMEIINLGDITEQETYETGPSEFLDYINNASAFFTDSFHGVVFSIIFETPFVVYERQSSRPSMYSRIETILDNFNMRDRESKGFKGDFFSMDFSGTHEVINREYNKSINYLKEALRTEE